MEVVVDAAFSGGVGEGGWVPEGAAGVAVSGWGGGGGPAEGAGVDLSVVAVAGVGEVLGLPPIWLTRGSNFFRLRKRPD